MKNQRSRGAGSVYLRPGSSNLWIQYYRDGVMVRESSGSDSRRDAEKLLHLRLGEIAAGNYIEPSNRKVTIDQLYEALVNNYRINKRASLPSTEARWQRQPKEGEPMPEAGRLKKKFSGMKAIALTTAKVEAYIAWCQGQGLENGTINRDIAALRRAFQLAVKGEVIQKAPHFPMLPEAPPRQGFLEDTDYLKLRQHARELWLRTIVVIAFTFGVRRGELVGDEQQGYRDGLKVRHADLLSRTIRLTETKNGDDRIIPMTPEVYALVTALCAGKNPNDWLFTRSDGRQVKDFRGRWARLKREAGVDSDLLLHDNRRSAVRNMERAGVPRSIAMKISGHKTESIYRRYAIVNEEDLKRAARQIDPAKRLLEVQAQFDHSQDENAPKTGTVDFLEDEVKPAKSIKYN